ncbi:hypothetical protein NW768_010212 [Fusarium equiseti]|uniref:Clr5 domain-containing protein n=1 Tax=Fusarium equiseti TaxID=61235 RepID=A0ABQ8R1N1_FUSEQ|nr:hypothetical protein NW768_010212 [Fusarium equiseti]
MDNWVTFPDLFEQSLTDQQPSAYSLPREFDPGNELALHDFISAQQATNLLGTLHPLSLSQENLVPVPQDTVLAAVNDAELTTAAMDPPPKRRKEKGPTLRDKDWEPYKDRIFELVDSGEFYLHEIKEIIEEKSHFTASLKQYQARISKWGKDKKIKKPEMAAIVRKRQQRKLVEVDKRKQIFSVRGRNVEPHKIDRWMVRHEVSQTSLYAPSPVASKADSRFLYKRG